MSGIWNLLSDTKYFNMKHGTHKVDGKTVIVGCVDDGFERCKVSVLIVRNKWQFKIPDMTPNDQLETVVRIYIAAREAFDATQNQLKQYGQLN